MGTEDSSLAEISTTEGGRNRIRGHGKDWGTEPFGRFNLPSPDRPAILERAAVAMPEGTLSQTASVPRACAFPHFPWLTHETDNPLRPLCAPSAAKA